MTRGAVRTALAAIICVVGPFGVLNASQQPPAARVVITHVTIVDVVGGQSHPDMTVVVSRGHIESITESARDVSKTGESNEKIVDARGKFLIPGLWDMHTHMAGINASPTWAKEVLLPLLVANGITGIRDMGGDLDALLAWRRAIESGQMIAPHIVAGGPMLLPARRPGATPAPADPSVLRIGSPEEARDSVDSLQKRGADFIKIIQLPRDSYFAVAEEARKDGISFVGHVPPRVTATEASTRDRKVSSTSFTAISLLTARRRKRTCASACFPAMNRKSPRPPTKPTAPSLPKRPPRSGEHSFATTHGLRPRFSRSGRMRIIRKTRQPIRCLRFCRPRYARSGCRPQLRRRTTATPPPGGNANS